MAIKGLTHQKAEFPEIGQLRKGSPKEIVQRGNAEYERWGKDLTYFRFTSEIPEVIEAFEHAYDGEPRLINVFLPHKNVDENWEAWQEEYQAGGLVHRCDGETMVRWQKDDGSYSDEPKPCPYESGETERTKKNPGCHPTGRLKVLIPELRRLAYVTVMTGSWHDIRNLDAQLRGLEKLRHDLRGIPLQLRRSPHMISTPGDDGKRVRREKWLLAIEAAPTYVAYQLAAQEAAAIPLLADGSLPELNMPDDETVIDGETGEIVQDEKQQPGRSEPKQAKPPEPKAGAKVNGRPLIAVRLREFIRWKSGWHEDQRLVDGDPASDGQVAALAGLLADALGSMSDPKLIAQARHDIMGYLLGVRSGNDLLKREASAMISWLKVAEEESWTINQWAATECARVLEAVGEAQGQKKMSFDQAQPMIDAVADELTEMNEQEAERELAEDALAGEF